MEAGNKVMLKILQALGIATENIVSASIHARVGEPIKVDATYFATRHDGTAGVPTEIARRFVITAEEKP